MSSNFNNDNFERLLKDKSDEFRMYPTKRVWYSIYNNIHPGRKWPSIAMCITLISILLIIGFLNTSNHFETFTISKEKNNFETSSFNSSPSLFNTNFLSSIGIFPFPFLNSNNSPFASHSFYDKNHLLNLANPTSENKIVVNKSKTNEFISPVATSFSTIASINASNDLLSGQNNTFKKSEYFSSISTPINDNFINLNILENDLSSIEKINSEPLVMIKDQVLIQEKKKSFQDIKNTVIENDILKNVSANIYLNENSENSVDNQIVNKDIINTQKTKLKEIYRMSEVDKAWVESYALNNRPLPKKWLGKLGWQVYITPSIVYRTLKNTLPNEQDINNYIVQKPSIGLEIGSGIISSVLKNVKLKTGLQLNFTRYNAEAFENSHPVATSITVHSDMGQTYQESRSTPYSNNDGISPIKLHNETFKISVPMGMDVKIASFANLQWSVGATIQPSYLIGGKSYLISSDKRNYIKESSLLNRWNLDAGFETFISYQTNGFTLQFGPQFRKQLFTTNNKSYFIQEHLTNYGFKFGISKLIK